MTEEEWLAATDPPPMLKFMATEASDRQMRLFACGCIRSSISRLAKFQSLGASSFDALDVAEAYADGLVNQQQLADAYQSASLGTLRMHALARRALEEARGKRRHFVTAVYAVSGIAKAAEMSTWERSQIYPYPWDTDCGDGEYDAIDLEFQRTAYDRVFCTEGEICRDIFGNPFRPVAVDPAWLTSTVVGIAHGIYDDRAFDRLPILADALQDAGCEDADVLTHCRGSGPHVRGCWVVDLLTGRT